MSKATTQQLDELHALVATELAKRIQSGEATAADFGAAIKFLQNNNIQALATPDNPLGQLANEFLKGLPFAGDQPSH